MSLKVKVSYREELLSGYTPDKLHVGWVFPGELHDPPVPRVNADQQRLPEP